MHTTPLYLALSHLRCLLTRNRKPALQQWDEALLDIPEQQWSVSAWRRSSPVNETIEKE